MEALSIVDVVLKWIVAPVAAFVWMLHSKTTKQGTEIAVIQATMQANKEAHDREFKEMRASFNRVFEKLDGIEQALRK